MTGDVRESHQPDWSNAALILAHPGHELLLHHWLESSRPLVFLLTDGSGSSAPSRISYSRRLIEKAGARCGSIFGEAPDRVWYRAILRGDGSMFRDILAGISEECARQGVTSVVCDPVELFNPMHDLANAAAHAVAREVADTNKRVPVFSYPIETPEDFCSRAKQYEVRLSERAASSKLAAVNAYSPLSGERPKYEALIALRYEKLAEDAPAFGWPLTPPAEPYYESFGRRRMSERRYNSLITYAEHVRPLALEILRERPIR